MKYINMLESEIKEYMKIFYKEDYPLFIEKYINTKSLQRINGIDLFCGMGNTKVPELQMKYKYSRLDHSITCAIMVWNLTRDKVQTLCALFHDCGTPAFSHVIDFKMGDSVNQSTSEKSTKDIIENDEEVLQYLKEDGIDLESIIDPKKYPIIDKKIPAICVDRLDGVFSTGLIWGKFWTLEDIKKFYSVISIFNSPRLSIPSSERAMNFGIELGIEESSSYAEEFYEGCIKYSILLQSIEDKFCMAILGKILNLYEELGMLKPTDFYTLSEEEIIEIMLNSKYSFLWKDFTNIKSVRLAESNSFYSMVVNAKFREIAPLVETEHGIDVLTKVSEKAAYEYLKLIEHYRKYNNALMTTDLSTRTIKLLRKLK